MGGGNASHSIGGEFLMSNYIVDGSDLTSIANAIRAKSGGSSQLIFPAGFVSEIQSIQTGGGSSSHTVTVSLSDPYHGSEFSGCILKDGGENGTQIGTISSPTGSTTVTVTTGLLYVEFSSGGIIVFNKSFLYIADVSTGIGVSAYSDDDNVASALFAVALDGSIDFPFIEYDD